MCGRYTLHHSTSQLVIRFGVNQVLAETSERYNIAPAQKVPVVLQNQELRQLDALQWGLVPAWAKDPGIGNKMINARAETVAEKPSYRQALAHRRCLIPADGFYEWRVEEGKARQPVHLRLGDAELFAFAGLWEAWKDPSGEVLRTCTIVTTVPNDVAARVHDRMPVMLMPEDESIWLDTSITDASRLLPLLRPYPSEKMEAFAVSTRVNRPGIDDPALLNSL